MTYGERLRELRAERRLSLRQVEERGGPNKDTMSLVERDVHRPHPQTLGRIAQALEMSVAELRAELEAAEHPLGEAPPSEAVQRSFDNHIREERRAEWENAVENARALRETGRVRLEGLLSSWRATKERGESPDVRRGYLDKIGELLQEAYDAEMDLFGSAELLGPDELAEVQIADRFYVALWDLVHKAGLRIRTGGDAAPASSISAGLEGPPAQTSAETAPHTVEEPEAA